MKNKILYRVSHESKNDYRLLTIEAIFFNDVYQRTSHVVFRCQGHPVNDNKGCYYATKIEGIDDFTARVGNFLNRLLKFAERSNLYNVSAQELINFLHKQKAKQCVYDDRLSEFVAIEDVAPKEWYQFSASSPTGNYMSCVAPDEGTAVRELTKKMANYNDNWLQSWVTNGRPVKQFGQAQFQIVALKDVLCFGS